MAKKKASTLDSLHEWYQAVQTKWGEFLLCVAFHFLFPWVPLVLEWAHGEILSGSVLLVAVVYVVALGVSSEHRMQFGMAIIWAFAYIIAYQALLADPTRQAGSQLVVFISVLPVVLTHLLERYNKHVVRQLPFLGA